MDEIFKTLESVERTVVDNYIRINDIRFDVKDLFETLSEVESGGVTVNWSGEKVVALKSMDILESTGNRQWMVEATLGKNGKEFIDRLQSVLISSRVATAR